jgi:AIPR protein
MNRTDVRREALLDFSFHNIRNITSPEDAAQGRKVYAGTAPGRAVLALPNNENVRDYIVEAAGKRRRTLTAVHRAMFETLREDAENFAIKNGGVVIVAHELEVDEGRKVARLLAPSLINGAQTQGVLADYYDEKREKAEEPAAISIKYEIVVTDDRELIGEISIARNSQNNVDPLSIAGKKGVLDDLQASMLRVRPDWRIRLSETDGGDDFIDTPKLLQVTTALIPPDLWPNTKDADNPNKVYTYSMRAKCLKDFQKFFNEAHDPENKDHLKSKAVYDFIVDVAPRAWKLYLSWKTHQGFIGTNIQQGVTRDEKGRRVEDVADGIVFPVLAALSVFVERTKSGWAVVPPPLWEDKEIFIHLKDALGSNQVKGNPWNLGKHRDAWTMMFNATRNHKRMAEKFMSVGPAPAVAAK